MKKLYLLLGTVTIATMVGSCMLATGTAAAADGLSCPTSHAALRLALKAAVAKFKTNNMWAVVVNHDGVVCAVAFSGRGLNDQWLLSRQVAAAKAFTTNGLSTTPATALTTAQLAAMQSDDLATLTGDQLSALTTLQLRAIETADIDAIGLSALGSLTAAQVGALSNAQLAALGSDQWQ